MEEENVIRKIKNLYSGLHGLFQDDYAYRLPADVSRVEGRFLGYISENQIKGIISSDLVRDFHLKKSTVSETLNGLEEKGFILFAKTKEDGRKKTIVLAPKGMEHEKNAAPVMKDFDESIESILDDEEKAQFDAIYQKLMSAIAERSTKK